VSGQDLLVRPGTSHGELSPGAAATSSFTVTNLTGRPVTLDRATVTGIDAEGACGVRTADVHVTSATVEGVHGVVLRADLRPAVFTVDLAMGPRADAACAGARFTPTVAVRGTDDTGRSVAGVTTTVPSGWSPASAPPDPPPGSATPVLVVALLSWAAVVAAFALWRVHRRLVARRGRGLA
jgi:hypothetical protein